MIERPLVLVKIFSSKFSDHSDIFPYVRILGNLNELSVFYDIRIRYL